MVAPWEQILVENTLDHKEWSLLVLGFVATIAEISIPLWAVARPFRWIMLVGTTIYTVVTLVSLCIVRWKELQYFNIRLDELHIEASTGDGASARHGITGDVDLARDLQIQTVKTRKSIESLKKRLILTAIWSLNKELLVLPLTFALTTEKIQSQEAAFVVFGAGVANQLWNMFESLANSR